MTRASTSKKVVAATLVRTVVDAPCYPGMERVGQKLARGLAEFLSGLMSAQASVTVSSLRIEEPEPDGKRVGRQLILPNGRMEIAVARETVMSLVDLYYGGDGIDDQLRDQLSPAENRFLTRIAEALCNLLAAAWAPYGSISPRLDEDSRPEPGPVAVQTFAICFPDRAQFEIHCRYPPSTLEAFPGLQSADGAQGEQGLVDHGWQARLMGRALDVTFPVRAVFAEPEVPIARLMRLSPGDVIPLCLPTTVEVRVSGLPFARGSAGESNGRAAICIDHL